MLEVWQMILWKNPSKYFFSLFLLLSIKILGTKIPKIVKKIQKEGQKLPDIQPNKHDSAVHHGDNQLNNQDNMGDANKWDRMFEIWNIWDNERLNIWKCYNTRILLDLGSN